MNHPMNQHQPPRPAIPPVAGYLDNYRGPGLSADGAYVVLPRFLLEQLPYAVQQQVAHTLHQVHHTMATASWPAYKVVPSRWAPINELDEQGLREANLTADLDPTGELVYRELTTGRQLLAEETTHRVLVSSPDHRPHPHRSDG